MVDRLTPKEARDDRMGKYDPLLIVHSTFKRDYKDMNCD